MLSVVYCISDWHSIILICASIIAAAVGMADSFSKIVIKCTVVEFSLFVFVSLSSQTPFKQSRPWIWNNGSGRCQFS